MSNAFLKNAEKINTIDITGDVSSCLYDQMTLKATLYQGLKYEWSCLSSDAATFITNDSNEIVVLWSKAGLQTVQLSNCAGTFTKSIEVHSLPKPIVDHAAIACEDSPSGVKVLPGFSQSRWENKDGLEVANGNEVLLVPGTYQVKVTDANGCRANENFTIQSYPKPNVFLSSPDEEAICKSVAGWQYPELVVNTAEGGYVYQWFWTVQILVFLRPLICHKSHRAVPRNCYRPAQLHQRIQCAGCI